MWQGIAGTRIAYAKRNGFNPNTLNDKEQGIMYLDYVEVNYGSSEAALDFKKATVQKNPLIAPTHLQAKAKDWIAKGYKGY